MKIAVWLAGVLIALAIWLKIPNFVWQYLFYLRVPLLLGVGLVALPFLANGWLRAMLRNLFVLRGRWQLAFVIISALMTSTAIVLVASVILSNAPARFGVPLWITLSEPWQYGLAIGLALPVCVTATVLSKEKIDERRWLGVATGVAVSAALLFLLNFIQKWLDASTALKPLLLKAIALITKQETAGYIDPQTGELATGHLLGIAFLILWLAVYGLVARLFRPHAQSERSEAAALLYVMLIITGATLLLGGMTFFFDVYRVLPVLLLLAGSAVSYAVFNVNHFYQLLPLQNQHSESQLQDFVAVLEKRLQHQTGDKTLVVVCASGGGIQAAGWTVAVLSGLQKLLGISFTQATGLISTASGGSVGTMYFLDRFNLGKHCPDETELESIFSSATRDSLDAVGWGLAYPDLLRLLGFPFLIPKLCDRGKAVETDWQGELKQPKQLKSLGVWREQVLAGQIPIPVFNATLVEDGRRFLISPMTFVQSTVKRSAADQQIASKFVDFNSFYGDYDINIVTAARLSATFPYISPICRNDINLKGRNYHVADGGYFDNSGIFTAVEWLDNLLSAQMVAQQKSPVKQPIKRIVILQINAFPASLPTTTQRVGGLTQVIRRVQTALGIRDANDPSRGGWSIALLGPLLTLFRVRDSTQTARNEAEIELLRERWEAQGVTIKHCPIFFPSLEEIERLEKQFNWKTKFDWKTQSPFFNSQEKYDPPLSWKLTNAEKAAIKRAWKLIACDPHGAVQDLHRLWAEWQMNPPPAEDYCRQEKEK